MLRGCSGLVVGGLLMGSAGARAVEPAPSPAPPGYVLKAVDVFGSKRVGREAVLAQAALPVGQPVAFDNQFLERLQRTEDHLRRSFPIAFVKASAIGYLAGEAYVTIDLVDRGDEGRLEFAPAPEGSAPDPAGLVAAWQAYEMRANALSSEGKLDLSHGPKCSIFHCLAGFGHPELAPLEERFIKDVPAHFAELGAVVARDRSIPQRAAAAYLLAYGRSHTDIVSALVPAIRDPAASVRNNAMRVLLSLQKVSKTAVLPVAPLLAALRFPETTDRNKASLAIQYVVEKGRDRYRDQILRGAGDVLVEMAGLEQPNNREPAIAILKLLSGENHGGDVRAWSSWLARALPPEPVKYTLAGIDVYGTKVPREQVLELVALPVGKQVEPASPEFQQQLRHAEAELRSRFHFPFVQLIAPSYQSGSEAGHVYVSVDIVEPGDEARLSFRPAPTRKIADPGGLIAAWQSYERTAMQLWAEHKIEARGVPRCRGTFYCWFGFEHPELAPFEERFVAGARREFAALAQVLRHDRDIRHRVFAAFLLAYGPSREAVAHALLPALDDSDLGVRNSALIVLRELQEWTDQVVLPVAPLLKALRRPVALDREKAAYALVSVAQKDPAKNRAEILRAGGQVLVEMAGLEQPNNRWPACALLRLLSGEDHGRDANAWRAWRDAYLRKN